MFTKRLKDENSWDDDARDAHLMSHINLKNKSMWPKNFLLATLSQQLLLLEANLIKSNAFTCTEHVANCMTGSLEDSESKKRKIRRK